jgi:ABC-2 type transport system ATP-binding protein
VLAHSSLDAATLRAWPGVQAVDTTPDGRLELQCEDAEALLRRWLAADPQLHGLEVRPQSLEDAFLRLTGDAAANHARITTGVAA